ncbi:hypothetical protein NLU13_8201 [Sarocladium strictum]|uniref:Meiotically up-regulated protein Msb1/Mug8 domain-containing protein n=1 Tax=Sarocladium strictum TaxID=5046 RepID=A0AA39GB76_SARSR|nr:hypothetical protein NLU13_8201 [Sarocladium strictum]
MPGLFSRLKGRDGKSKKKNAANSGNDGLPKKPQWDDAYTRKTVEPEEIHELIRCCTEELKARALDLPFLLLPFRPTSDPSAVRTFIRHFFDQSHQLRGEALVQEIRMTEPMVIAGVTKWCWSRLSGGVVGWDAYELFKVGEIDSNMARDSFKTFIPISVENGARQRIIFDFFDLLAAIAAHGKRNGLGGRKLSRMAAWWAFEQKDTTKGFEGGYGSWLSAADATSHLFFAYLRSLSPEQALTGISMLPMSLQKLVQETEYPPVRPDLMMTRTNKVVMVVDAVSPTPFALLRRANHFQYRESDQALQEYASYDDPVQALTDECCRVLKAVSAANQSHVSSSKHSTGLRDASWSRFEDIGFTSSLDEDEDDEESVIAKKRPQGLMTTSQSTPHLGRPTTPSWADFLSSGFMDDGQPRSNLLLPPDKVLPPIDMQARQRSSQSHRPRLESDTHLEPGELASITVFDLDDSFWWVWMSSLAPEETPERKSAFGRCAVIETKIRSGRWLVMEEMVAGAAPEPAEGAYIAEKKGFFSWTRRSKTLNRRKSTSKQALDRGDKNGNGYGVSKTSIGPDTHAKIQAKAAQLRAAEDRERLVQQTTRRGRPNTEIMNEKTNSILTLQPNIVGEASTAMKWAKKYDKGTIKDAYMANTNAGRGMAVSPAPTDRTNGFDDANGTHETDNASNGFEQPPVVPSKDAVTPVTQQPTPVQSTPEPMTAQEMTYDKAAEAGVHPVHREEPRAEEPISPAPPPKEAEHVPDRAQMVSPEPTPLEPTYTNTSHDGKKKKLYKDPKEKTGGFRKLFGRKNRASKLPENAAADVNGMLKQNEAAQIVHTQQQPQTPSATPSAPPSIISTTYDESEPPVSAHRTPTAQSEASLPTPKAQQSEQFPEPTHEVERTYAAEPAQPSPHTRQESAGHNLTQVDSRDEAEAKREFSRFDQGPLDDQPAFVPDDQADEEDDATPPPIARHPRSSEVLNKKFTSDPPEDRLSHSAGPGVQDRWAQIRKNAAERAAVRQSEEQSHGAQSKTTDGDDDTSGEETIESRVARIKARVAELTGNMEGSSGPQQAQPQQGVVRR